MTLRLTVDRSRWQAHVDELRRTVPDLVPVVKGNGYGLGRVELGRAAARWADEVALGTVHELTELPAGAGDSTTWLALTPALDVPELLPAWAVPTVGRPEHVHALTARRWQGRVAVKLCSSMRRYGATPDELAALLRAVLDAGCHVHCFVLHPPLVPDRGDDAGNVDEIEAWLPAIDPSVPVSVSHLSPASYRALRERHPERRFRLRSGTALWHGDKTAFHLSADVLDVRAVDAGGTAGYRRVVVPDDGHVVMVGTGSAHGVAPLLDGRSPFHHARRRVALLEPPHMHTSMLFVRTGEPLPEVGDWIDVQRPLIGTAVDEVHWT